MMYSCFQAGLYIIIYMRSPIRELDYPNLLSGFFFKTNLKTRLKWTEIKDSQSLR